MKLQLGIVAPTIMKQMDEQDLPYNSETIEHFQNDRDALNRLRMREILPNSVITKGFDKLFKNITKHVEDEIKTQEKEDEEGQEGQYGAY